MAGVSLRGVTRKAGGRDIVDRLTLEVEAGEYLALLGPSGCGKTSILRLLAGFDPVTGGEIRLGGDLVSGNGTHVPPEQRRVGVVFQSYALWPHLDVAGNVGYALRVQGVNGRARAARVAEALETVGLAGMEARRVQQLSGGQRQRVALARCLAMRPRLVLLDEPLANLDAHLRAVMVDEFRRFHAASGATVIHVTHDQAEAMALADRVAVLQDGRLQQCAPPRELYARPATPMVAQFVGRGHIAPAEVLEVVPGGLRLRIHDHVTVLRGDPRAPGPAQACLRPADLELAAEGIAAQVISAQYEGAGTRLLVAPRAAPDCRLTLHAGPDAPRPGDAVHLRVTGGWVLPDGADSEQPGARATGPERAAPGLLSASGG